MTPTQLRTYVAVVRLGASKAAAAELGVSEAAVSNHVAALRKELDDQLFERSGSGLRFTPGGLRLASRAVEMLGLEDQTRNEVRSAADGRRTLRLAVSSLFGEYAAPGLIELFSTRADDLDVEMSVHDSKDAPGLLASRAADVAIGPRTPHLAPGRQGSGLRSVDLLRYELAVVASPKHRFASGKLRPTDLKNATWFLGPSAIEASGATAAILHRFAVPERKIRIFQSHAEALTDALQGRALAIVPVHRVADDIAANRLVQLDVAGGRVDGVWSVLSLEPRDVSPAAAELIRFATTPRAIQAMLSGSGANIAHFKPRVHVTLWS